MTGQQLWEAARDGDAAKVSTLLSTQGAQSFINFQSAQGITPLHCAAFSGHEAVTEKLLAARCSVNLQWCRVDTAPRSDRKRACGRHNAAHCSAL